MGRPHRKRWGTPLECLLLMMYLPQVVPTYGYYKETLSASIISTIK